MVALKGQAPKYPVSCSLLDLLFPVPVFLLLQALKALELLQHMAMRAIEMVFPNTPT